MTGHSTGGFFLFGVSMLLAIIGLGIDKLTVGEFVVDQTTLRAGFVCVCVFSVCKKYLIPIFLCVCHSTDGTQIQSPGKVEIQALKRTLITTHQKIRQVCLVVGKGAFCQMVLVTLTKRHGIGKISTVNLKQHYFSVFVCVLSNGFFILFCTYFFCYFVNLIMLHVFLFCFCVLDCQKKRRQICI